MRDTIGAKWPTQGDAFQGVKMSDPGCLQIKSWSCIGITKLFCTCQLHVSYKLTGPHRPTFGPPAIRPTFENQYLAAVNDCDVAW